MHREPSKSSSGKPHQARIVSSAEAEIAQFMNDFARAIRGGSIDEIMSFYASDVVAFDMMPPLEYKGLRTYRKSWEVCFTDYFHFPLQFEFSDQHIVAGDDFAFTHSISHMSGTSQSGDKMEAWMRNTTCLKRRRGKWVIVHEHNSVPLDADSKGIMDLPPDGVIH